MTKSFAELGKEIKNWGPAGNAPSKEVIAELFEKEDYRIPLCLLAAILNQLQVLTAAVDQIPKAIEKIPNMIARDNRREEKALEKEKQKTAKAQQKANEAMPPTVTVIQMQNEEIERAVTNGRVARRF